MALGDLALISLDLGGNFRYTYINQAKHFRLTSINQGGLL